MEQPTVLAKIYVFSPILFTSYGFLQVNYVLYGLSVQGAARGEVHYSRANNLTHLVHNILSASQRLRMNLLLKERVTYMNTFFMK